MSQQQESFNVQDRFEAILRGYSEQKDMAAACRLVVKEGLEPLLEAWRRGYGKVPPDLSHHLKAQSEFCAIMSLAVVLNKLAAEAPERGEGQSLLQEALAQAEAEAGELQGEQGNLE